jgi:hypothetical protein
MRADKTCYHHMFRNVVLQWAFMLYREELYTIQQFNVDFILFYIVINVAYLNFHQLYRIDTSVASYLKKTKSGKI